MVRVASAAFAVVLLACGSTDTDAGPPPSGRDLGASLDDGPARRDEGPLPGDDGPPLDAGPTDAGPVAVEEAPCGIYLLSSRNESGPSVRFMGDRDLDYVDGFIIRPSWLDLEPTAGDFDFSSIDDAMARMEAQDQQLTIQILGAEPAHVVEGADDTWIWFDPNPRHTGDCADDDGCVRALPWDEGARTRQEELLSAMADHLVEHDGRMLRLAEHPRLDQVLLPLVGWGRFRELGFQVEDWPGYSRATLVDATRANVEMHYRLFPGQPHQLQLFPVSDGSPAGEPPLWSDLVDASLAAAGARPAPIFLMENLVHRLEEGDDVFNPSPTRGGAPLLAARDAGGAVGFQMLTAWSRPFPGQEDAVADGSPIEAIRWAMAEYGARYFEVYTIDLDAAERGDEPWAEGFAALGAELCAPAP